MCKQTFPLYRILLAILLVLGHILGFSQDYVSDSLVSKQLEPEWPQNIDLIIKTNPLAPLAGSVRLTSEYLLAVEFITSAQQSSQISVSYLGKSPLVKLLADSIPDWDLLIIRGYRIQINHKFYLLKKKNFAPVGFYLSPHTSFTGIKVSTRYLNSVDHYLRVNHFSIDLLGGWQFIFDQNNVIDVYMGWGYKNNFWEEHQSQNSISINSKDVGSWYNNPIKFTIGFTVGLGL